MKTLRQGSASIPLSSADRSCAGPRPVSGESAGRAWKPARSRRLRRSRFCWPAGAGQGQRLLDFVGAREQGRERQGRRPSRGRRGKGFRRLLAGIPTARFRDRLTQMTRNAGLWVIAVDPAYTSRWGREHWLAPLREQVSPIATGHHAAAVVIGRRAHGHRARRRAGVPGADQRISHRRATPRAPVTGHADRDGRPRKARRQPHPRHKTAPADRPRQPAQATQHRPGPPADPVFTTAQ